MKTLNPQHLWYQRVPPFQDGGTRWRLQTRGATALTAALLLIMPLTASGAAKLTGNNNVSIRLDPSDFGISDSNPHMGFNGTANWDGGAISGGEMSLATVRMNNVVKTGLVLWTYTGLSLSSRQSLSASYSVTNKTLTQVNHPSSSVKIADVSDTGNSETSKNTYKGTADITLDLTNTSYSGDYKTVGSTITVTVTIM